MKNVFFFQILLSIILAEIDIFRSKLDAPIVDIIWCGDNKDNDRNIIVLTEKVYLYDILGIYL